jgi:type I restriction enzyme S subunit
MRDGWRRVRLGDAVDVTIGRQRSPRHANGDHIVRYLRAANVKDGRLLLDDVLSMNFEPTEQNTYRLTIGDVLVTEGCGSIGELGASAAWGDELMGPVCFQNTLLRLRARPGLTLPAFVETWARWAYSSGIWAAHASGTNIFHIGATRAREIELDLPTIDEQRRIVDLVGSVDAVIASARRIEELARHTAHACFLDCIANAPGTQALGKSVTIRGGKRLPKGTPWSATKTDHPYIRVTDISDGRVVLDDLVCVPDIVWPLIAQYVVLTGDVIISIVGTIGEVALIADDLSGANLTENAALIRPTSDDIDGEFLAAFLRTDPGRDEIRRLTVGTTQKKLALFRLASVEVPFLPPDEQRRAAGLHKSAIEVARSAQHTADRAETLRSSLLSELFSGKHWIPSSYDALLEPAS